MRLGGVWICTMSGVFLILIVLVRGLPLRGIGLGLIFGSIRGFVVLLGVLVGWWFASLFNGWFVNLKLFRLFVSF